MSVKHTADFNPDTPGAMVWALIRSAQVLERAAESVWLDAVERRELLRAVASLRRKQLLVLERTRDGGNWLDEKENSGPGEGNGGGEAKAEKAADGHISGCDGGQTKKKVDLPIFSS